MENNKDKKNSPVLYTEVFNKKLSPTFLLILALCCLGMVAFIIITNHHRGQYSGSQSIESSSNLRNISIGFIIYRVDYNCGPNDLAQLIDKEFADKSWFTYPFTEDSVEIIDGKLTGDVAYVFFLDVPQSEPNSKIIGYEKIKYAQKGKVWVVTNDGRTTHMTVDELNKELKAQGRGPVK